MKKQILIFVLVSLVSFAIYLPQILNNHIKFQSDELYWIQTGRILPYILRGNFESTYWHETMGFTNFNGAKWIYAIGLRLFGHTAFEKIGTPPQPYYLWNRYDGAEFPIDHELYPFLLHGRIVSSFIAAAASGCLFLITLSITGNVLSSSIAMILLVTHPIYRTVTTHALADSSFLLFGLLTYILLLKMFKKQKNIFYILVGISFGYFTAIKINALMFAPLIIGTVLYQCYSKHISKTECLKILILITIGAEGIFLLIHPNFFFYRSYTPSTMLQDRITITQYHMEYFRNLLPGHVLDTIPSRIQSLTHHIFTLPISISIVATSLAIFINKKKQIKYLKGILIHTGSVFIMLLLYVVFDEQRYFLPLLPFLCIFGALWVKN